MPLTEARFKIRHDCPFVEITNRYPGTKMFVWCNRDKEVVEVIAKDSEAFKKLLNECLRLGDIVESFSDNNKLYVFTTTCDCTLENSVTKNIDACDLLHLSPVIHVEGWEYHSVISFNHDNLERFMKYLDRRGFEYDILKMMPLKGHLAGSLSLTAEVLFSTLTDKQMDAILKAYSFGYFNTPRISDAKSIARKIDTPRTTFQEHLNKAENKLISSLVPYIQAYRYMNKEQLWDMETPKN
ncbi:hypothetical protein GF319_05065 [Candidatus Bathyarchaeota archaeon]|jgi:hypothetical protein|nr:hypothetical protein [Candidatus Bathyarchaeota archaeon]